MKRIIAAGLMAATLALPAFADEGKFHFTLVDKVRGYPAKILVMPVDVNVYELGATGATEKQETQTLSARKVLGGALNDYLASDKSGDHFVKFETASDEEAKQLEQTLALYDLVAGEAFAHSRDPVWEEKRKHFDYTLGPVLQGIRERTGADAALVVVGEDYVSSGGRVAMMILFAAAGVGIPMGFSYVTTGLVDLRTGDLLWINYDVSAVASLNDNKAAQGFFKANLKGLLDKMATTPATTTAATGSTTTAAPTTVAASATAAGSTTP